MNCTDYRNHLVAEPEACSDAMQAHVSDCDSCVAFAHQIHSMNRSLRAAMQVDVPDNLGQTILLQKIARRRRRAIGWYALAASVLASVGLAAALWQARVPQPIAGALIAHINHELHLLEPSTDVVAIEQVGNVLRQGKVMLNGNIGSVRHAGLCPFRGKLVPHLVVNTRTGPVTVMLLPDEAIEHRTPFEEGELKGILVPVGRGSIAIIGSESAEFESLNRQFSRAVEYSI